MVKLVRGVRACKAHRASKMPSSLTISNMLTIRLIRIGKKNQPFFRVVVTDKKNPPKGGRFLEIIGFYNPLTKENNLKKERLEHWLSVGAQPSDRVRNMLIKQGIIKGKKIAVHAKSKKKQEAEPEGAAKAAPSQSVEKPKEEAKPQPVQEPKQEPAKPAEEDKPAEDAKPAPEEKKEEPAQPETAKEEAKQPTAEKAAPVEEPTSEEKEPEAEAVKEPSGKADSSA